MKDKEKDIIYDDFFGSLYDLAEELDQEEEEKNKNDEKHPS